MFSRTLFNASVTMAFSATATARRTWPGAENSWRCPCQSRDRNATTGNGGNNSPGTIHWSVRNAARGRWCESLSFLLAAQSKLVIAHKLCNSPTPWVRPAPSVAHGSTTRVSPCQFSWFYNAPHPWDTVSPPLPPQPSPPRRRQLTQCPDHNLSSRRPTRTLIAIQNT